MPNLEPDTDVASDAAEPPPDIQGQPEWQAVEQRELRTRVWCWPATLGAVACLQTAAEINLKIVGSLELWSTPSPRVGVCTLRFDDYVKVQGGIGPGAGYNFYIRCLCFIYVRLVMISFSSSTACDILL